MYRDETFRNRIGTMRPILTASLLLCTLRVGVEPNPAGPNTEIGPEHVGVLRPGLGEGPQILTELLGTVSSSFCWEG